MLIKRADDIRAQEITPKELYWNRRKFLTGMGMAGAGVAAVSAIERAVAPRALAYAAEEKIAGLAKSSFSTTEKITPISTVTHYNNYYEFSTEKEEPAKLAQNFKTQPWMVAIDGDVSKKQKWDLDTILKFAPPEERIYRHRCVEGWSIVVPWVAFSITEICPAKIVTCSSGLMSKACAWMRPCTRLRFSRSGCMERHCPIRTA